MPTVEHDHDILIEVRTLVNQLIEAQKNYFDEHKILAGRITQIEVLRSGDNAKIASIQESVQRSLDNYSRINQHDTELINIKEEVKLLQKRSDLLDGLNALGVTISGVIGFIFGQR